MNIITNEAQLRKPSVTVPVSKGVQIGRKLLQVARALNNLSSNRKAVGLAAPQVGIHKQVCVLLLNNKEYILVNPRIVKHSHVQFSFTEKCLSFPGKQVETYRWLWVEVYAENLGQTLIFGRQQGAEPNDRDLLAAAAAQHEIDHLHGILMFDRTKDLTEPRIKLMPFQDEIVRGFRE